MTLKSIETVETVALPAAIKVGFRGRNDYMKDPGKIGSDPLAAAKLCNILKLHTRRKASVFYPENDHSGAIYTGGVTTVIQVPGGKDCEICSTAGDAVILGHQRGQKRIIALRTKDCVPILIYDVGNKFLAGIHFSNITGVGYKAPNDWLGPILHRVFSQINPATAFIWLGPAVGGIGRNQNGCTCYQYTQTDGVRDGTILIEAIQNHYPDVGLDGFFTTMEATEKMVFQWGHIVLLILLSYGVPLAQINIGRNFCTSCEHHQWYSHRKLKGDPDERFIVPQRIGNLSWIIG